MKKGFNIAANVCTIVLMGIMAIGSLVLISASSLIEEGGEILRTISIILLLFCIATIVIAALTLAKGNRGKALGLKITVIVLVGITAVLEFVGGGVVYGILCLIPIGLEIASVCVPDKKEQAATETFEQSANGQSVDEKIAELKRLKDLHAISDEQYEQAVSKIVNDLKK